MNITTMVFERNLFGLSLYSLSVAKSVSGCGTIMLNVEKNGTRASGFNTVYFFDEYQYDDFIGRCVSDNDLHYNNASALDCVIDALRY